MPHGAPSAVHPSCETRQSGQPLVPYRIARTTMQPTTGSTSAPPSENKAVGASPTAFMLLI